MEKTLPKRYKIECAVDEVEYNRILQFMKDTHKTILAEVMRTALKGYMQKWKIRKEEYPTIRNLQNRIESIEKRLNGKL